MKSTRRLIDNIMADKFRHAKIDLQKAKEHTLKVRVENEKKKLIKQLTEQ